MQPEKIKISGYPLVWVVTGIAGAGKSVVGRLLSERLDCDFLEGDRRHPPANIIKMLSQTPLQDEDRFQWLLDIESDIGSAVERKIETVITCSALRKAYRRQLSSLERVQLVWIDVPVHELKRRLMNRTNHYMRPEMLDSQVAACEPVGPEEKVLVINGLLEPHVIVDELLACAMEIFPTMKKPWWMRSSGN